MSPEALEERLRAYLNDRSRDGGDARTVNRTVAAVFERGNRPIRVRSRRVFMVVALALAAAIIVAAPITVFEYIHANHTTPATVVHPTPSPTARFSVQLGGSPGIPAVNLSTGTLYVPIQCTTSACTNDNIVDLINTATCKAADGSGCRVVAQVVVGLSPQAVAIDQTTDTIYVATWDFNGGESASVLNGARCNARNTSGCGQAAATVDVGGVGAVFNPKTRTLYVADPQGGIHVINGATCNAETTSGCGKTATLADNYGPNDLDIDQATDTIYAVNNGANVISDGSGKGHTVSVIDGATCNGSDTSGCNAVSPTVSVGNNAQWDAVDQATGAVYVSNYDDGTVSVIDGTRCNATNTSGCTRKPAVVRTGGGSSGLAVDDLLNTVFAVGQNDDTLSAINMRSCNGIATSGCTKPAPSEQAGADGGAAFNAFPNYVTLVPQTDTAYLVSVGGTNVLEVVSVSGCNATEARGCRSDASTVAQHEFEASFDSATDTIYASNYNLPEIDVFNGATCKVDDLSGCAPVGVIPMPDPMAAMGAIDDTTHTLYVSETFRTVVAVINTATCNATDATGCFGNVRTINVGAEPGAPALNPDTRTLYLPYGTAANQIAVLNAATCNAEDVSGCGQKPGIVDVGPGTDSLGVSLKTDTIYAPSAGVPFASGTTVSVINGATCNGTDRVGCGKVAATITVGIGPDGVAVDDATNTVYVTNSQGGSAPGTVSIINGATCNGHTVTTCARTFPTAQVGRAPQLAVADTSSDSIFIIDTGGAAVSVLNGANCNATDTSGCGTATSQQAVSGQPTGIAVNPDTGTVYVMTFLVSASLSIFAGQH